MLHHLACFALLLSSPVAAVMDTNATPTATQLPGVPELSAKLAAVSLSAGSQSTPLTSSDGSNQEFPETGQPSVVHPHATPGIQSGGGPPGGIFPMLSAVFGGLTFVLAVVSLKFSRSFQDRIRARRRSADLELENGDRREGIQA